MANAFRGEASFEADGKTYTLIYDANALCEIEDELSTPGHPMGIMEIATLLQTGMSMKAFRAILHGGLTARHPDLTIKDAGNLISMVGFDTLGEKVGEAFGKALPDAPKGHNQGNARRKRGAGPKP